MKLSKEAPWDALSDENDIAGDLSALATDIEEFERLLARILREESSDRLEELTKLQSEIARRVEFLAVVFGCRQSWASEYDAHLASHGMRQRLEPLL